MEIEGSTLRLDVDDRDDSLLTGVLLPDGSSSGGLILEEDGAPVLVLFTDEDVEVGDEIVLASRRQATVVSVRPVTLDEETVTLLEIRPREVPA